MAKNQSNFQKNRNNFYQKKQAYFSPYQRKWIRTPFGNRFSYSNKTFQSFVLMSYNILAQDLLSAHSALYRNNESKALNWNHRLHCLKQEIIQIRPAILCLQEVQNSHFSEIKRNLQTLNYDVPLYKKRNGGQNDGCAIFFNRNQFELIDSHFVEYFQPNINILDRYNVAIIAKLALKSNQNVQCIVATTHLLFNPRRNDIRTAQVQLLLAELDRLSYNSITNQPIPIILTGDFNCQENSETYRLITDGCIQLDNLFLRHTNNDDAKLLPIHLGITDNCQHYNVAIRNERNVTALYDSIKRTTNNENTSVRFIKNDTESGESQTKPTIHTRDEIINSKLPFNTGTLRHSLCLMPTIIEKDVASTYHDSWITVDYIFYTKYQRRITPKPPQYSSLQLLANLGLPKIRECNTIGPIPNLFLGSDHFSMASEFVLFTTANDYTA